MKRFISKLFIILLFLCLGFTTISCKSNKQDPTLEDVIKNFELTIQVGEEKNLELDNKYKYDVKISDNDVVNFNDNKLIGKKAGRATVTITTSNNKDFRYTYAVIVLDPSSIVDFESLEVLYQEKMVIGSSQSFVVKLDGNTITSFEVFIDNLEILKYSNNELVALKVGASKVIIMALVDGVSLKKEINVTVTSASASFDEELVVDINSTLYANQTISFTVKTKDNKDVSDFEVEVDSNDVIEIYPEDLELATLDEGSAVVTFKAVIDGKTYGKVLVITVVGALSLEITIDDVITTEKPLSYKVIVMPDNVELTEFNVDSSNKQVFTITNTEITPLEPGKGLIIISGIYNGVKVSETRSITVKEYVADYIDTNIDNFMIVHNVLYVKAQIKPSNEEIDNFVITSSDNSIIDVYNTTLQAKSVGKAVVTVKANGLQREYEINVIEVESIEINVKSEIDLHEVISFEVIAKPSNTVINQSSLDMSFYSTEDNLLVNDHVLFGNKVGTSELIVRLRYTKYIYQSSLTTIEAKKTITIKENKIPVERLSITTGKGMIVGSEQELTISRFPENGEGDIIIKSSDSSVIEVNGTTIKALKEGECVISASLASDNQISATALITVMEKKNVEKVSDGLFNGNAVTARYREEAIKYYYELMCGVKETTYIGSTSTELDGDVDGYSGITGSIVHNEYYLQNVHVLEVPSRKDVVVVPWANLNGNKWSLTTVKGLIGNFEEHNPGYKVIAAVNGDFFDINANKNLPYSTTGENVSNGEFYKVSNGFSHIGGTIGFTNDGSSLSLIASANDNQKYTDYFVLDIYDDNGDIIKSFHIDTINAEPSANGSSLYFGTYNENKNYVPISSLSSNTFIVENAELALPSDYYDFYGKGVISKVGQKELQVGDFAITTNDNEILTYLKVGVKVRCQRVFVGDFANVTSATGYNGVIFDENGVFDFGANGNLSNRAPRTVIGMKEDGTLVMMVVDGRQGNKDMYGCDGYELTAIMRAYGCIKAYNVDGGGSSTIVIRTEKGLEVLNSPSDGHERSDGNCILICTVDPCYTTSQENIKSDSATILVSTENEEFKDYQAYIMFENTIMKVRNGKVNPIKLVHNSTYSYRVYYEKDGEMIPTLTVGSFTTAKANFKFLGLYIEEKADKFILYSYSLDNDKSGNVHEMTVFFNDKTVYLKNGTAEVKKEIYGNKIEKIGYEYWFNSENGRETVTVENGLYFIK